jgi:membrane-bound lytic murein transglycosylase B
MMNKVVLTVGFLALASALFIAPGFLAAQNNETGLGKHTTKSPSAHAKTSMMRANMDMLAEITLRIYDMMSKDQMKPEEKKQLLDVMKEMSEIMKEMSVPHGEEVKKSHKRELHKIRQSVDVMYKHIFQ